VKPTSSLWMSRSKGRCKRELLRTIIMNAEGDLLGRSERATMTSQLQFHVTARRMIHARRFRAWRSSFITSRSLDRNYELIPLPACQTRIGFSMVEYRTQNIRYRTQSSNFQTVALNSPPRDLGNPRAAKTYVNPETPRTLY
jgi:hypothetical protein